VSSILGRITDVVEENLAISAQSGEIAFSRSSAIMASLARSGEVVGR
jgi:hypothetical protein